MPEATVNTDAPRRTLLESWENQLRDCRSFPTRLEVPYVDLHVFADELASYGPEVYVVSPQALRDEVIAHLERTLAVHGGVA